MARKYRGLRLFIYFSISSFIESNLWHEAFIIKTNKILDTGIAAPLVQGRIENVFHLDDNDVLIIRNTNFE